MFHKIRPHLTYANVMATIAVLLAMTGGAVAATKLKPNSVKTKNIKNAAVTNPKLSDSAVNAAKIAADAVTGAKVQEGTLNFPCSFPVGGAFHSTPGGLCVFKLAAAGPTWAAAVTACHSQRATLPTVAEIQGAAPLGGSPFRSITVWASEVQGGGTPEAPSVTVDAGGAVTSIATLALTNAATNNAIACAYEPASAPVPG